MSDVILQQSPLIDCKRISASNSAPEEAGAVLGEQAFWGHINLRGDPNEPAFLQAVAEVLGSELPLTPNTVAISDKLTAFWLGPNEWLLLMPSEQQEPIIEQLRAALAGVFAAVTDISSGQTVITLSGQCIRAVLAKGCTLDLHPQIFQVGQCAQTLVAKTGALLWPCDEAGINIIVRRSFADYLWTWLIDAADEYGFAVTE